MRLIILDTETTGFSADKGDRLVEVGCVEVINRKITGDVFHRYCNPERDMPQEAFNVHGLSESFLSDKPLFKNIAVELMAYLDGAKLVIHNADFDMGFLAWEYAHCGACKDFSALFEVIDTLTMAREKHPGQRNSLDALCKRYHVDSSERELHGALLDAELLARVYLAMTGGQGKLFAMDETSATVSRPSEQSVKQVVLGDPNVVIAPDQEDIQAHQDYIIRMSQQSPTVYQTFSDSILKASNDSV